MTRDAYKVLALLAVGYALGWFHRRWILRLRLRARLRTLGMIPVLVLGTFVPKLGTAQPPVEREVRFTPAARAFLASQWNPTGPNQVERGYCLIVIPTVDDLPADTVDMVVGALRAVAMVANPVQVAFQCGPTMRYLHVHTPTTCDTIAPHPLPERPGQFLVADCRLGGPGNGLCFPSPGDVAMLASLSQPWAAIQCAQNAFIAYTAAAGGLYQTRDR
jgi:hypothetical protein